MPALLRRAPHRVSPATKRPYSVDTYRNMLAEARMLVKFAIGKSWLRTSPLEGVEAHGKRRHGKEQLRMDEARRWTRQGGRSSRTLGTPAPSPR